MVFGFFWTQNEKRWLVRGGEILSQTEGYLIIARGIARGLLARKTAFSLALGGFPSLSPVRKSLLRFVFFFFLLIPRRELFQRKKSFLKTRFRLQKFKLLTACTV